MSRFSIAQSKLNDALAALESALASARTNYGGETDVKLPMDSTRLFADLQAVDAKVAKAVDIINASITAGDDSGGTP